MSSARTYDFVDHTFDVVVVGAGGAGLRATQGAVEAGGGCSSPAPTMERSINDLSVVA